MSDIPTSAWLAGRQERYRALAAGEDPNRADARAIIAEFESMHGPLPASEREAAVRQALEALERQRGGGRSWSF